MECRVRRVEVHMRPHGDVLHCDWCTYAVQCIVYENTNEHKKKLRNCMSFTKVTLLPYTHT